MLLVDGDHSETIECTDRAIDWAAAFLAGEMPIAQEHVFAVHDVCLRAQAAATLLGNQHHPADGLAALDVGVRGRGFRRAGTCGRPPP